MGRARAIAGTGWAIATIAFISPICPLSVALFSARIAQHMVLMLVAAPLIGRYLPRGRWRGSIWWSAAAFTAAIWAWHMPVPYEATFRSTAIYWSMHLTLFGSAIWLWRDLLNHRADETLTVIGAGLFACMQMSLLGAILCLSTRPWFAWYAATTQAWGLTQLEDQQLGGIIMWVPSGIIFLAAAARSFVLMHNWLERPAAA
jgi:putative membrane protein